MPEVTALSDWILQDIDSTGTGELELGAARDGYIGLDDHFPTGYPIANIPYTINDLVGGDTRREHGLGTLTSAGTFQRTTVLATLVSGSLDENSPAPLDLGADALFYSDYSSYLYGQHWSETDLKLENVVEDATPQLGGSLETLEHDIKLTAANGSLEAFFGVNVPESAVYLAHVNADGDYEEGYGGIKFDYSSFEVYGNEVKIDSLQGDDYREVRVNPDGVLYGAPLPETGWVVDETSADELDLGLGTSIGQWYPVADLVAALPEDVENGTRLDYTAMLYIENVASKIGTIDVGLGLEGADPTNPPQSFSIGANSGVISILSARQTTNHGGFTENQTLTVFVRRGASQQSGRIYLRGNVLAHEYSLSKPGDAGGSAGVASVQAGPGSTVDNSDPTNPIVGADFSGTGSAPNVSRSDHTHGDLHTQNTDQALDAGGANEVLTSEIRGHIDVVSGNPHGTDAADVGAEPANGNIQSHIGTTSGNPHGVTAALSGAEPANANIQTHIGTTSGNPHNIDNADVGLGNVDNTADANKPVSGPQQTALDAKLNKADDTATNVHLAGYSEQGATGVTPSGTLTLPLDGGEHFYTVNRPVTLALSGLPALDTCQSIVLTLQITGGEYAVAYPATWWHPEGFEIASADGSMNRIVIAADPAGNIHISGGNEVQG